MKWFRELIFIVGAVLVAYLIAGFLTEFPLPVVSGRVMYPPLDGGNNSSFSLWPLFASIFFWYLSQLIMLYLILSRYALLGIVHIKRMAKEHSQKNIFLRELVMAIALICLSIPLIHYFFEWASKTEVIGDYTLISLQDPTWAFFNEHLLFIYLVLGIPLYLILTRYAITGFFYFFQESILNKSQA